MSQQTPLAQGQQTPRSIMSIRSARNQQSLPKCTRRDIYERLQSRSLHTLSELKSILRDLFVAMNEGAKRDFETIFSLNERLIAEGFIPVCNFYNL
jgi:hypothetical protein